MPRVLFDKNVPYPLRQHLADCHVKTAEEEGWGQVSNGEPIALAEKAGYQIFLTCDQNIRYQQNISHRKISMIVLGSNILPTIGPKTEAIVAAVKGASPGSCKELAQNGRGVRRATQSLSEFLRCLVARSRDRCACEFIEIPSTPKRRRIQGR